MKVLIPFRQQGTKSSLSTVLKKDERRKLSILMLKQIAKAINELDSYIVSPDFEQNISHYKVYRSPLKLNEALKHAISDLGLPVLILPSDIPLITKKDVENLINLKGEVVLSPGEREGTNALLLREKIPLKFSGKSFPKHLRAAKKANKSYSVYESYNIHKDLDQPNDIKEIIENLPPENKLKNWLSKRISGKERQLPLPKSEI